MSLFLKAEDKDCVQRRVTLPWYLLPKGVWDQREVGLELLWGFPLYLGKGNFVQRFRGGTGKEGGHCQQPCWDSPGSGWGLPRSLSGRECSLLLADAFLQCSRNGPEMHQNRSGAVTSLQHPSFCLFIFAFNLKLLYCHYTKYIMYLRYIKAVR